MRLLFIHGRAQGGKDPDELQSAWIESLHRGFDAAGLTWPKTVVVDFPYYGNKLDELTEQAISPSTTNKKGEGNDNDFLQFQSAVLTELREKHSDDLLADEKIRSEMGEQQFQERGPQNWAWVQATARIVDRHLTTASDIFINTFLRDVFLYLERPAVTRAINSIVERTLTCEPTVVIGHSLGSVVAYKVIHDNHLNIDLRRTITVGSPLGIKAISSKLGLLKNHAGSRGWYNSYDTRDIIALNPLDDIHFPTDPAINNDSSVDNHTDNRHGIVGYLDEPELARQLAASIKPPT